MTEEVSKATSITLGLVRELNDRLDIEPTCGVSRRRLGNYLKRLWNNNSKQSAQHRLPATDGPDRECADKLREHRQRQVCVSSILNSTFGKLSECDADLWGHRAYLMLIGLVYERLAADEDEMPTDELVALAKIIAENRRVELGLRKVGEEKGADKTSRDPGDRLPDNFGNIVRQVYGTNFHAPDDSLPAEDGGNGSRDKNGGVGG